MNINNFYTQIHLEQLFESIKNSHVILSNTSYKERSFDTSVNIIESYDINAYASKPNDDITTYKIVIYRGIINSMMVTAYALQDYLKYKNKDRFIFVLKTFYNLINNKKVADNDVMKILKDIDVLSYELFNEEDHVYQETFAFLNGMVTSVIAHELGHVVLGHVDYTSGSSYTKKISRDYERQADLFSYVICNSLPYPLYTNVGSVFAEMTLYWLGYSKKDVPYLKNTHPWSKERVLNAIRSHKQYLDGIGLDEEVILQLI